MKYKNNTEETNSKQDDVDFDEWMELYKNDPDAFEHRRKALIKSLIDSAPPEHQRRLNGLQFQIDMERRRSDSPLQSCMQISSMMWDKFDDMRKNLALFQEQTQQPRTELKKPKVRKTATSSAKVLAFSPK